MPVWTERASLVLPHLNPEAERLLNDGRYYLEGQPAYRLNRLEGLVEVRFEAPVAVGFAPKVVEAAGAGVTFEMQVDVEAENRLGRFKGGQWFVYSFTDLSGMLGAAAQAEQWVQALIQGGVEAAPF